MQSCPHVVIPTNCPAPRCHICSGLAPGSSPRCATAHPTPVDATDQQLSHAERRCAGVQMQWGDIHQSSAVCLSHRHGTNRVSRGIGCSAGQQLFPDRRCDSGHDRGRHKAGTAQDIPVSQRGANCRGFSCPGMSSELGQHGDFSTPMTPDSAGALVMRL